MPTNNNFINLSGSITKPGEEIVYTFVATAGQQFYFDRLDSNSNSSIVFKLVSPSGDTINNSFTGDYGTLTLTETGTYQVLVNAINSTLYGDSATTGSFNLNLLELNFAPPLNFATTISSSLSPGLATNIYRFAGTKGERIQFNSLLSGNATWGVYGTNNQLISSNAISKALGTSFTVTLPNDGEYYLAINGNDSASNIAYSFVANNVSDTPVTPTAGFFGVIQSGTVAANTSNTPITFAADAGELIIVNGLDTSSAVSYVIRDLNNSTVISGNTSSNNSSLSSIVLPRSGNYTLTLSNNTGGTANYSFQVLDLASNSTPLTLGTAQTGTNPGSDIQSFSFTGTVGEKLFYDSLLSGTTSANALIIGPSGNTVVNFGNTSSDSSTPFTLTEAGTYYLIQQGTASTGTVNYNFQLLNTTATTLSLNTITTGTLAPLSNQFYSFTGTAGEKLYFDEITSSGFSVTLYDANNQSLGSIGGSVTLPSDGTYLLQLNNTNTTNTNYSFNLTAPTFPTAALTLNTPTTGTISQLGEQDTYTFTGKVGQHLYFNSLGAANINITPSLISPSGVTKNFYEFTDSDLFTLTEAGTYKLVINSSGYTGKYSFQLIDPNNSPQINLATTVSGSLSPLATNIYQFAGTKGERIQFNSLASGNGTCEVYGTNSQLISSNAPNDATYNALGTSFTVTLPDDGEYYLAINGNDSASNIAYSFVANNVSDTPVTPTAGFFGVTQSGTVAANTTNTPITFAANAGELILVHGLDTSSAVSYVIRDPNNNNVFSSSTEGYEYINYYNYIVLPQSGNYTLTLSNSTSNAANYNLRVLDLASNSTPLTLGTAQTGTNPGSDIQSFSFTGTVGENLFYESLLGNTNSTYASITEPSGDTVLNFGNGDSTTPFTLTEAGTYYLIQQGSASTEPVNYNFQLLDPTLAATPLALNTITTRTLAANANQFYTFTGKAGETLYFDGVTEASDFTAIVYDPDNKSLGTNYFSGFYYTGQFQVTLPSDGTYLVDFKNQGNSSINYSFNVFAFDPNKTGSPTLTVENASGNTNSPIPLNISVNFAPSDGKNIDSITIGGLPTGATLSAGTNNGNGSYTLTPAQLAGLTLTTSSATNLNLNVTASATEITGDIASTSVILPVTTLVSQPPVATNHTYYTKYNQTLTVNPATGVLANDSNPNGKPLTAVLVSNSSHGALTFNSNGSFNYIPNTGYIGTDTFTYKDNDGNADSNTATVTLNIINQPPVATTDTYYLSKNNTLTVSSSKGVLSNDSDPNGAPITAVLASNPSHGTLSFNPNGSFTYTPTTDYVGADTFTYKANDGSSDSNTATVTLNIKNVGVQTNITSQFPGIATVTYTNIGLTDVAAPLFKISATNAQVNNLSSQNGNVNLAQLLGLGIGTNESGQFGILSSGSTSQFSFGYTPSGNGTITSSADPAPSDGVIDWATIESELRSSPNYGFIAQEAWNAIWTNFTNSVGNTYGSLQTAVDQDANYFSQIGQSVNDISQLLQFELAKASNSLANTTIASTNDISEAAPGISLTFNRTFYNSLVNKDQVGSLGVGWSSEWDIHFATDTNGNVTIYEDGGQRLFTKLSDGTYYADTGDYGQLTLKQGQYLLQEKDGTLYAFRSDNQQLDYVQDTNGNRVTANYTGGLLTSLVHSNGESLTLSYNSQSTLSSIKDSAGQVTTYTYDGSGQHLLSVTTPQGTTSYTYSNSSNPAVQNSLLSITNPDGTTESFSYDNQGHLTQRSGNGGAGQVSYTYNQGSVQATDALGNTSSVLINTVGQASQVQNPLGSTLQAGYDSNYNLTSLTALRGLTSSYQYDSQGNLVSATDLLGNHLTLSYTPTFNKLQSLTDQRGNTTGYSYDTSGNLTGITYADGTSESFSYDSQGDVTQSINQKGNATNYTYNAQGLLLSAKYADGSSLSYTYDKFGNLTSATDASGTTSLNYDSANRLTKVTYSNGESLSYTYNGGGQRTSMVDQSGFTTKYSYNTAGQLAGTTDTQGHAIATYTYDAAGNLTKEVDGNGTYKTYQYDSAGQVLHLINYAADNTINSRFDYTYNSLGEQTSEATLDGTWTYQYNALAELTNAVFASTNSSIASQNLTYIYDAAGNRIQTLENGTQTNYATNNVNQYTTVGTTTEQYDANGNLISQTQGGVSTSYTYNAQNRLTGVSNTSGNTWSYTYDALGNRISSTHNGQQTNYLVDPTGLGNVVGQYDSSGKLISNYTYGLGLTSQVSSNGSADYYDFNSIGSTVGLTGANGGSYLDSYSYSPFGENLSSTGTVANPFQYIGQYGVINGGNGLDLMGAREYDSTTGRFTQEDPTGINGGINLYAYTDNSPTNAIDPTGTISQSLLDKIAENIEDKIADKTGDYLANKIGPRAGLYGAEIGFEIGELIFPFGGGFPGAFLGYYITQWATKKVLKKVGEKAGKVIAKSLLDPLKNYLSGDPHLTTLDGTHYDFQGAGEFTLVKSTTDDFEIQARLQPLNGNTTFTANTAVSLQLGGQRIGIYLNDPNPLKINGNAVNLPDGSAYAVGTDLLTRTGNSYNILSANNDLIQVTLHGILINIDLALAANRQGKVVGLLGNDNSNPNDDFALRNGTVLGGSISSQELYGEYANSWRITQATSLFDYATGENTNTFTNLNFPTTVTTLNTLDPQAVATAKQIAQNAGITDPTLVQDATYDLAVTNNNTDFLQGYTAQQKTINLNNPNTITNLSGYGTQHWITGNTALPYTVNFSNNAAQGTNPVAQVTITEKLDSNLDLSTFGLSNFGFEGNTYIVPQGVQNYSKQIDLTSTKGILVNVTAGLVTTTGIVTWTFTAIDPATGKPVTDLTKGFLPPNDQSGAGSGYVGYTIQPKANVADSTVINAQASITFDSQTPTQTAAVFNTVEKNPLSSLVNALSTTESNPNFTVSWKGNDADSGIAYYNIYVSTNGGQYVLWQNGTTATSATYNGQAGNTYAFYSVATDNAGLTEAAHTQADTTTSVLSGSSQGDVHLTTFDGIHYDFQGAGEFTLVKSTTDDFEIQTRQQPWNGNANTTVNTAVALQLGGQNIGLYLGNANPLVINHTAIDISDGSSYAVGTDSITRTGNSYNIQSANNDLIQLTLNDSYINVGLALAANRQGNVVGLLGNDNPSASDEFALRDGTVLGSSISNQELYGEYGNSWRITQATSLFDYVGQVDYLTGLPDSNNSTFKDYDLTYNGGPLSNQAGHSSYAVLEKWQSGDQIILNSSSTDYVLESVTHLNGFSGTGIYQDINHNGIVETSDHLIALVVNGTGLSLNNTSQFHFS